MQKTREPLACCDGDAGLNWAKMASRANHDTANYTAYFPALTRSTVGAFFGGYPSNSGGVDLNNSSTIRNLVLNSSPRCAISLLTSSFSAAATIFSTKSLGGVFV